MVRCEGRQKHYEKKSLHVFHKVQKNKTQNNVTCRHIIVMSGHSFQSSHKEETTSDLKTNLYYARFIHVH